MFRFIKPIGQTSLNMFKWPMIPGAHIPTVVLLTATVAYAAQFYLFRAPDGTRRAVLRQRLGGALFLGGLPLLVSVLLLPEPLRA